MKVAMPGGSGQVGTMLARSFHRAGHDVVVFSRKPFRAPWRVVPWDGRTEGAWIDELDAADAVINLAGRSVNCRYTAKNRKQITDSRVESRRIIGTAIARVRRPPAVWLQATTATIYAHRYDAANDEFNGILGGSEPGAPDTWRFSIEVAKAWERALDEAVTPHTRKVNPSYAVMDPRLRIPRVSRWHGAKVFTTAD
jgi:NAD dependent epimerase/dehydratase family enzyme